MHRKGGRAHGRDYDAGDDLAKSVMHLHGVDGRGVTVLRRQLCCAQLPRVLAQLPACTVAMEACAGAHDWGRRSQAFGHQVRLIAPQFVKPFVKGTRPIAMMRRRSVKRRSVPGCALSRSSRSRSSRC